jgi:hypothetical protein
MDRDNLAVGGSGAPFFGPSSSQVFERSPLLASVHSLAALDRDVHYFFFGELCVIVPEKNDKCRTLLAAFGARLAWWPTLYRDARSRYPPCFRG